MIRTIRHMAALIGLALLAVPGLALPTGTTPAADARARAAAIQNQRLGWMRMRGFGGVMASPPTVTTGTASALSGGLFYAAAGNAFYNTASFASDRFSYSRGVPDAASVGDVVLFRTTTVNAAGTSFTGPSFGVSFIHTGQSLELSFAANSNSYLVRVDDQYVTLVPQAVGASGAFFAKYDFGSVGRRRIDVVGSNLAFRGVTVGSGDSLDPAPVRGPRVIVLGDSFTAAPVTGWTNALADQMGWDDVWSAGLGGNGYLAGAATQQTFRQRSAHDVIAYQPDIVIVQGSVNDDGNSAAAIGAEAALLYAQLRGALPDALIVASPTASGGANRWPANKLAVKDALQAAATAAGVLWIDPLEMPLALGSGGGNGGTLSLAAATGATGIRLSAAPQAGSTIEIGSGSTRERVQVKSFTGTGSPATFQTLFDGALQYAHGAGEPWRQVGAAYLTGRGNAGAPSGFGNSDLYVAADGVHPTMEGAAALGAIEAMLLRRAVSGTGR